MTSTAGVPQGKVTFSHGDRLLGVVPLDAAGRAALPLVSFGAAPHTLLATYTGQGAFASSTTTVALATTPQALTLTVNNAHPSAGKQVTLSGHAGPLPATTYRLRIVEERRGTVHITKTCGNLTSNVSHLSRATGTSVFILTATTKAGTSLLASAAVTVEWSPPVPRRHARALMSPSTALTSRPCPCGRGSGDQVSVHGRVNTTIAVAVRDVSLALVGQQDAGRQLPGEAL